MVYMTGLCYRSRSLLGGDLWEEAITFEDTEVARCWVRLRVRKGPDRWRWRRQAGQAITGSLSDPSLTLGSHWGLKYRGGSGYCVEDKSRGEPIGSLFRPWRKTGTMSSLWVSSVEVMRRAWIGATSEGRADRTSGWVECSRQGKEKLVSMLVCVAEFTAIPSICAIVSRTTPPQMFQLQMCGPGLHFSSLVLQSVST